MGEWLDSHARGGRAGIWVEEVQRASQTCLPAGRYTVLDVPSEMR